MTTTATPPGAAEAPQTQAPATPATTQLEAPQTLEERIAAAERIYLDTDGQAAPAEAGEQGEEQAEAAAEGALEGAEDAEGKDEDKGEGEEQAGARPKYEELLEAAKEARKRRLEAEQQRTQEDQRQKALDERERRLEERLAALEKDPIEFLKAMGRDPKPVYERMTKLALERDKVTADERIQSLESKLEQALQRLEERDQQTQQQREQERVQQAYQQFLQTSGDAEKFPLLSRLDDEYRIKEGDRIAAGFAAAGKPWTFDDVAATIEENLRARFGGLIAHERAEGSPDKQAAARPPSKHGATKTLTAANASEGSSRSLTKEERMREAEKLLLQNFS